MPNEQFKVPLIQQDVSHEETVLQLAFALDSLQTIVETVFRNIEDGIRKERCRLQDLQTRCQNAKEKVQKLSGINKSITVYSSSKYPVPLQNLFFEDFDHSTVLKRPNIRIRHTPLPPNKLSLREKMKFYHVKDSIQLLRKNDEMTPLDRLGPVPDLKSLSSLLLFNTDHNIYKQYKIIDPLVVKPTPIITSDEKMDLEPAPASLLSNEPLRFKNIPNYFYNPISQDVPDIHVPLDLPRLSGIAGDLRYDEDAVNEIETKVRLQAPLEGREEPPEVVIISELPKIESTPSAAPPPPPPPPPPPIPPPQLEISPQAMVVPSGATPLPKPRTVGVEKTTAAPLPPPDGRANLMEAIRQAGGSKQLKPSQQQQQDNTSTPKGGPMSLMEDLHNKLLMRRKGILGKSENAEGGILGKMALLIPPPPAKQQDSEDEEQSNDWDD